MHGVQPGFVRKCLGYGYHEQRKKKKGYRPDQLRSCKVIPALECCQNVASGEAKQDITCLAMC